MSVLSNLRDRVSRPGAQAGQASNGSGEPKARVPFAGYDRLDARQVADRLHDKSQVELAAIEDYERSDQEREAVLDKLRWMCGPEPLDDYDTLSAEQIVVALDTADLKTVKRVRAYERKFANRPQVLDGVVRVQHRRLDAQAEGASPRARR